MMDILEEAQYIAHEAHIDQSYGDRPYTYHLQMVQGVLEDYGFKRTVLLVSAWLHDIVEDTDRTLDQIEEKFGAGVADIVRRVTDEPGDSREERKQKTYPKIREDGDAITIKLADRIANVRACVADERGDLFEMYRDEHPAFYDALCRGDEDREAMWGELNRLLDHDPSDRI